MAMKMKNWNVTISERKHIVARRWHRSCACDRCADSAWLTEVCLAGLEKLPVDCTTGGCKWDVPARLWHVFRAGVTRATLRRPQFNTGKHTCAESWWEQICVRLRGLRWGEICLQKIQDYTETVLDDTNLRSWAILRAKMQCNHVHHFF